MASQSNLSSPKYGYDFVISTTQASINSGLLDFLDNSEQEATCIFFVAGKDSVPVEIELDKLLKLSNNVNPFDIPSDTPFDDPRIRKDLIGARFMAAIKIRMGLPSDMVPKELPSVVNFGSDAGSVGFNMLCSELTVINCTPPGYDDGKWEMWEQPSDECWYFSTLVSLTVAELDKKLDGPIYFQKHKAEKEAILRQLSTHSSTPYELQQILYDLEGAAMVALPKIKGIEAGSTPDYLLNKYFINVYAKHCQAEGLPLFAVTAKPQSPDPSQLQMTSFQRQLSHLKDNKGNVIQNPDTEEQAVTTLDFLCVTDDKPLPGTASFGWNWVEKNEVDNESGVISINRAAVGHVLVNQMRPAFSKHCASVVPWVKGYFPAWVPTYKVSLRSDGAPDSVDVGNFADPTQVIQVNYHRYLTDYDEYGWYSADFNITTDYTLKVYFGGTTITIEQEYKVHMYLRAANNSDQLTVYDPKRWDRYDISVGQFGDLIVRWRDFDTADGSEKPHTGWFVDLFVPLNEIINDIKNDIADMGRIDLDPINFDTLQSFIFPGSRTFAFKSPVFSDYQDLVCKITYVNPSESHVTQTQLCDGARNQGHALLQGDFPAQNDLTLTYSSEMLDNYIQGEIVSPYSKFEALQTGDGHALLFAIDTSGVFHVIKEQSGTSSNGWEFEDLSSAVIAQWYVDVDSAETRTFDVGQSAVNGTINLALAISEDGIDTLFVSLGNDSSNVDWTSSPKWTRIPFDDIAEHPTTLKIASVLFVETSNKQEYLIVDIDRPTSTGSSKQCIARYHIDLSKTSGSYWVKHDVPVDIEDGSYKSTVGRVTKGRVDGVYTSGFSGKTPQLVYVPVENIYGSGPPEPRRLSLPDNTPTYAIAASRYGNQTSNFFKLTDLFCVGGSTLYRFAPDKQSDGSKASPLITSDCLSGTNQLQATMDDGVVTICGKNGNDQLFYTSCLASQVDQPGSWSAVVPILSGVEQFSTYINKADGGNTIFASGGGKLFKLTQSTATGAKMWRPQEITLAVPAIEKPLSFNSYTTTVHISNKDDLPAGEVELEISTDALTPFYINGLYYLVGPKPIVVSTNSAGIATIVEAAVGLNASILTVAIRHGPLSTIINPMQKAFAKMTSLDSEKALREASFPAETIAGGTMGATDHSSLIDSSASADELQKIASGMAGLQQAWDDTKPPNLTRLARLDRTCSRVVPATAFLGFPAARGAFDFIAIAAGDLFRWLKSGVEAIIELVKHAATDAWHFVATIAGKVYRAVLDTVEAVVGAVEWLFDVIKTAIEKLIQFVKFLFDWGDIQRTKDVLTSVVKLYMGHQIGQLSAVKDAFDGQIMEAKKSLRQWAGMDDWSSLGDASSKPASGSASSPAKGQTSSSMLFASHFRDNASSITVKSVNSAASKADVGDVIEALLKALSDEGPALSGIYSDLATVASQLATMSVSEALKALAAVLAEGVLLSAQVVVDALLDTLNAMGSTVMDIMDTQIHIPVISDILDMIGIPAISFLDLFLWIGAVSYDVVYKIAYGEAPFPNNNDVKAIISAESWESLTKMFGETSAAEASFTDQKANKAGGRVKSLRSLPQAVRQGIHIAGHATAGFCLFMGDFLVGFEAEALTGDNPFSIPAAVLGGMIGVLNGASGILVPMCPVENTAVSAISTATTAAGLISKVLFSGYVQKKLATSDSKFSGLAVEDGRATGAIVSSVLLIPQIFVTGCHFYELSQVPASKSRTAAILGEVANLTAYGSTLSYAMAVNDKDINSRQIPIAIMLACNIATGGLQTAEAFQVDKARQEQPSPDHGTVHSVPAKGARKQITMRPGLKGTEDRLSEMRKPSVDGIRKLSGKLNGLQSPHLPNAMLIRGPEGALPN